MNDWAVVLVSVLLLTVPLDAHVLETPPAASAALTPIEQEFMDHIDHIIFVVMENHAYDSYFGTYCQVKSKACPSVANGIPSGTCVPEFPNEKGKPCIRPWNFTAQNWSLGGVPMLHNYNSSIKAWNNGLMNGFYHAENSQNIPFGHYNGTTAPTYWDIAEEYTLEDNFFSSIFSYSLPNHWHIVAGQAPAIIIQNFTAEPSGSPWPPDVFIPHEHTYLNESNKTTAVEDLLVRTNVSWNYYDQPLAKNYQRAIEVTLIDNGTKVASDGSAYNYFDPLAAKAESYTKAFVSHFVSNTQFYSDARNGTLPSISWVIPPGQFSDHPPDNSTLAQNYVASLVDALESSPDWNSSIMYITWDDYGGFYDHVDPPVMFGEQLGFRVPLLVVSPYSVKGSVPNATGYFESILRGMEWRFGLGCITALDCNAPLPLWGLNFSSGPRAPILFPTDFNDSLYPFNPDWNGTATAPTGNYDPPEQFVSFPDGEAPDID
ncbi:MAG TPA: alkaline phosphatase family protein [Thermoplasmata archaeon]|nr:alkaline phosphatase family protein [Thermoplasmata archaeon]